jgi:hypothetical protein
MRPLSCLLLVQEETEKSVIPVICHLKTKRWGQIQIGAAHPSWKQAASTEQSLCLLNDSSELALCKSGNSEAEIVKLPQSMWSALAQHPSGFLVAGAGYSVLSCDDATGAYRILEGKPEQGGDGIILALDGMLDDFIGCGFDGEIWRCRGGAWKRLGLPAPLPVPLSSIARRAPDHWYVAGRAGTLIEVKDESTRFIEWNHPDHPGKNLLNGLGDIWGVAYWEGALYISTMRGVFRVNPESGEIIDVDFGENTPGSTYGLAVSTNGETLVSWGAKDIIYRYRDRQSWQTLA